MININNKISRPINIEFTFSRLNGKRIAFFEPISELVDWAKINKWFKRNFPAIPKGDSKNFHHVLKEVDPE